MSYFDSTASGSLSGMGTGAAVGTMMGGPGFGTALGAGGGAILGGLAGFFRGRGQERARQSLGNARWRLEELARAQRAQREADLQRALSYFDPVKDEMQKLYG